MMQNKLLIILGPTAVGKTSLSIDLAAHLHTEIISTDSRQFYREMNIGTAKPTQEELQRIPHHFINNRSIQEYYSAGDFEKEALQKLESLFHSGKHQMIAIGGSGLYIKALCEGLDEMPKVDLIFRKELIRQFEENGITWLQKEMAKRDPQKWNQMDQQNPQRLMRAIELHESGGIQLSEKKKRPFQIVKIGLNLPREILYQRINERVDSMMEQGFLAEAKDLYPYREMNALQTVGYNELFDYLDGKITLDRAVDLIKQHTRNFAKRQMTWFKSDPEINWFNPKMQSEILDWVDLMGLE